MNPIEILSAAAQICGYIASVAAVLAILVKPVREKVLGTGAIMNGLRCQLRADMLRTYYRHREEDTIRQYEKENFVLEYKAYKALGGNSFIDDIYQDVRTWEVVS